MMSVGLLMILSTTIIFILIMAFYRRTLWSGFTFLNMLISYGLFAMLVVFRYSSWISAHRVIFNVILMIALLGVIFLVALPIVIILMYLIEGFKVIRKEGLKITNCLSLGFFILVILVGYAIPKFQLWLKHPIVFILGGIIELIFGYLLFMATMYVVSALLNLFHLTKNHHFDYVVVLGSGLKGDQLTPLLKARVEKGIDVANANSCCQLILSGGQGPGEDIAEGEAMAAYAISQGMDQNRVLIESKSRNTIENLRFSMKLMKPYARFALVTTSYHVFHALIIARKQKINCLGYGAKTKWYFTLNAIIREFVGYLTLNKKMHITFITLLVILFFIASRI